ncbi:g2207 [Coccomyxa viridis]|uniref:G2207 protein n=1 Tax=Coccomyxa viridis TaxID=1274662 RepID=A0ABP1FJU0_9CHLO
MATAQQAVRSKDKVHVLFVCLGNICRSPTAEAVFRAVVERAGMQNHFVIDSCGTGGGNPDWYKDKGWAYHEGDPSDQRMLAAAAKRGVCLTSRSRPLRPEDMTTFDYILGMDFENNATIQVAADYWLARGKPVPSKYREKVQLMCRYLDSTGQFKGVMEVPDPYYGGAKGFELVLDLLEEACEGLLQHIREHDLSPARVA